MEGGRGEEEKRKRLRRKVPNNFIFFPSLPFCSSPNFCSIPRAKTLTMQASFDAATELSVLTDEPSYVEF